MFTRETNPAVAQMEYFHLKLMRVLERQIYEMGYNLICKTLSSEVRLKDVIAYTGPPLCFLTAIFKSSITSKFWK